MATAPSTPAPATASSSQPYEPTSSPRRCADRRRGTRLRALPPTLKESGVPVVSAGDDGDGAEPITPGRGDACLDGAAVGGSPATWVRRPRHLRPLSPVRDVRRRPILRSVRPWRPPRSPAGRVWSAQDCFNEQKRDLEGFALERRASNRSARPRRNRLTAPVGPDAKRTAGQGLPRRQARPRRKAKRDENPFDVYAAADAAAGQFPKGVDNFRWCYGLFYVAPTQSTSRRAHSQRHSNHWQLAGIAEPPSATAAAMPTTTRANLQIREIDPATARR